MGTDARTHRNCLYITPGVRRPIYKIINMLIILFEIITPSPVVYATGVTITPPTIAEFVAKQWLHTVADHLARNRRANCNYRGVHTYYFYSYVLLSCRGLARKHFYWDNSLLSSSTIVEQPNIPSYPSCTVFFFFITFHSSSVFLVNSTYIYTVLSK